jgi:hypothetical protein
MSQLNSNSQTGAAATLSFSTATAVSTADGQVRGAEHSFDHRLAEIRQQAAERGLKPEGGCGGVNGGWGN